jgi:hypothetical protein
LGPCCSTLTPPFFSLLFFNLAQIPLRDYLSGLVYARADGIFQASLDPIVKKAMQAHFAEAPASEYSQYVAAHAAATADLVLKRALGSGKIRKEIEDIPSTPEAKEKVSAAVEKPNHRTRAHAAPRPYFLRSCGSCGRSTGSRSKWRPSSHC